MVGPLLVHFTDTDPQVDTDTRVVICTLDTLPPRGAEFPPHWTVIGHNLSSSGGYHKGQPYGYEIWVEPKVEKEYK